jgi:type II secretory pathway component PulF
LLGALPLAGSAWRHLALTRWCAVMHFSITSGRKFSTALESAADASASAGLAAASRRLAAAASGGESIATAMQGEPAFPAHFVTGFATAEASGTLDIETERQTKFCMEAAASAMALLAEWLPRLLYAAAAVYAVWRIFQLAGAIGGQYQRALEGF